jgi:bifunctional enzyme CysN/CysC
MNSAPVQTLLRFVTCGSVDDGKSSLIGRLLFETQSIFEDQYEAIKSTSHKKGHQEVDLSLLLDGLAAEREQAITIDVAYRYFKTDQRRFIIADCPGHEQYTRNMVTGASNSDAAVVLIDARKGVLTQSKRHSFIVSLLRIPHLIVAINKMDLVDYSEEVFRRIVEEYTDFSRKLDIHDVTFIPVSALKGDNVCSQSEAMAWYKGNTLLRQLETMYTGSDNNLIDFRFPVQMVTRPHLDFRGYAGRVASGVIRQGEEVIALPSGKKSKIKQIVTFNGEMPEASADASVVLTLEDEIDLSRGDMLARPHNLPKISDEFEAIICWMNDCGLEEKKTYLLKHTSRIIKAHISEIRYRIDMDTLHRGDASRLGLNDIGRVCIQAAQPLFVDSYQRNRRTGAFILIDPDTNATVAAGMISDTSVFLDPTADAISTFTRKASPNTQVGQFGITREEREARRNHRAIVLWLTGFSGSGKTTLGRGIERELFERGIITAMLDGDHLRQGLCGDLGFSPEDRNENIRRVGETARLFFEHGCVVLCTFISPMRAQRDFVRSLVEPGRFIEVFVRCDLETCMRRDVKGLYKKANAKEITQFSGITADYEEPANPEIIVDTDKKSAQQCIAEIMAFIMKRIVI